MTSLPARAPLRVALLGFGDFERSAMVSYLRLSATRVPAYQEAETLTSADYLIADADHAGTLDDELALLVVHGILHVLGHDHHEPDETAVMRARELALLEAHHWVGPAPTGFRQEHSE